MPVRKAQQKKEVGMLEALSPPWPLGWSVAVFVLVAVVTVVASVRMTSLGDVLADRTGWGEAVFGAVFFGLATSLSGIVMTAVSAVGDQPGLAYSNAVGGIAAQTLALAVADFFYRRANLEHAAASSANLLFCCLLIGLLSVVVLTALGPDVTLLGVHPASVGMIAFYAGGLWLIRQENEQPMWQAVRTRETVVDVPDDDGTDEEDGTGTGVLWVRFLVVGAVVAVGGWALAEAAGVIVESTGLSAGLVGAVAMGAVNAIPETVAAVAAVRRGAMTLAVSAIIGGNSLDALNVAVGDVFYRGGSLYHAASADELFLSVGALLMTVVLLAGLIIRQTKGWGRIGFEGVLLIVLYLGILGVLTF
ncbi:cation transporter [Nocardiopsis dassonvillei]|jgi:cation:H+ antiporter|uniref:sodium:calcium antiporter n=1 Tax=Nocardiopsis dassonvillei TaxID=2014 RepID=UPI0010D750B3|nr:cation transporter [Nocardiopsis dassonvillei]MCP3012173.1 cation transporter [Nocardiopsis dassonvillei]